MTRFFTLLLSCIASLAIVAKAERLDFSSLIQASGTQCFLENIGETIQGNVPIFKTTSFAPLVIYTEFVVLNYDPSLKITI